MQCAVAFAPTAAARPVQRRAAFRSSAQPLQHRRVACQAASREDDNWEQDDGPKSWLVDSLPTSDEVKQQLKEFDYKGNLGVPMVAIGLALAWLASVFPGHH